MAIDSWAKLAVVILVSAAASVLGFYGKIDSQAVVALLSACLGYVFGNAHGVLTQMQTARRIASHPTETPPSNEQ